MTALILSDLQKGCYSAWFTPCKRCCGDTVMITESKGVCLTLESCKEIKHFTERDLGCCFAGQRPALMCQMQLGWPLCVHPSHSSMNCIVFIWHWYSTMWRSPPVLVDSLHNMTRKCWQVAVGAASAQP